MITMSTLSSFVIIVIGLLLIPGPALLLIATRTVQVGRKDGIITGLGIATGDLIHTLFAAIGLSAILMTSAFAFNIVKFAGVAYLFYLGIRSILENSKVQKQAPVKLESKSNCYVQAVLVEAFNPKTALFFLAFLPQFVHPNQGSSFFQFLTLGLAFVLITIIYIIIIAMSVHLIRNIIGHKASSISRWNGKIIGMIYIGLGLKVAFQSQ